MKTIGSAKKLTTLLGLVFLAFFVRIASAGPCDNHWEGEKLEAIAVNNHGIGQIPLLDGKRAVVFSIPSSNILAIKEAKEKIGAQIGRSPKWILCNGRDPNAFAFPDGNLMGVTIGMTELIGSDKSMAAMVIGHEYAHHVKDHGSSTKVRKWVTTFLGALIGGLLDIKLQQSYGAGVAGIGNDIGDAAGELVSMKFSRDQEREADQIGFEYLVNSGFDPEGSVRLANALQRRYQSGGYFFDSHPGWDERAGILQKMITEKRSSANTSSMAAPSGGEAKPPSLTQEELSEINTVMQNGTKWQIYRKGMDLYERGYKEQGSELIYKSGV